MEYRFVDQSVFFDVLMITINVTVALVCFLLFCVCCKRNTPKNELLGLEGMVKLKNPDEIIIVTNVKNSESQADLNTSSISNGDSEKRASTAVRRSLPDIPIAETNGDTGSELYETVADKRLLEQQCSQEKSLSPNLDKQISISQHSSISQADDVSSPYSRVKNTAHGYAKVLSAEHPYAQLNAPSTSAAAVAAAVSSSNVNTGLVLVEPPQAGLQLNNVTLESNVHESPVDIPAASAIAGMISASQDLPYMTPPVANQNFSGDSQDSSKGYTSISVREPLANILAQQPPRTVQIISGRDTNDSHYATVSDDSDETYAAIEDPNLRNNVAMTDIYTSGSETYAQIQPMQSVVVSVEINSNSTSSSNCQGEKATATTTQHGTGSSCNVTAVSSGHVLSHLNWPSVQASQIHSRQPSSSSNNSSSVGNLGSPKPEKRQANSPLPPTPKSAGKLTASNSNLASGRNSVISVIELTGDAIDETSEKANEKALTKKNSQSPSKDIEGMYAKVMKKNKFSVREFSPSQNNSPVMSRKNAHQNNEKTETLGMMSLNTSITALTDSQRTNIASSDKNRARCNSYGAQDHGYETIPADINRKSDCYTNILQKERQQIESNMLLNTSCASSDKPPKKIQTANSASFLTQKTYKIISGAADSSDPGYETLIKPKQEDEIENEKKSSEYDPNYEVVTNANNQDSTGLSDDGYAKVVEKKQFSIDEDSTDGYSKIKGEEIEDGYSTIRDGNGKNHNYASISEAKSPLSSTPVKMTTNSSTEWITRPNELPPILSPTSFSSSLQLNTTSSAASSANITTTSTMSTISSRPTPSSSQYESLTGSETDPNYESVSYMQGNRSHGSDHHPYEILNADSSDTRLSSPLTPPDFEHSSTAVEQTTPTQSITTSGAAVILNVTATSRSPATTLGKSTHTLIKPSTELQSEVIVDDYFQV